MKPVSKIDRYAIRKVKERRIALGKSQLDLANDMDVSVGFIGQVESDKFKAHYSLERLNQLAKVLKCSLYDFLPKEPL
ncbi:helix-turn-helix domain-containing protein [Niabella aurantiaca]|uniref:helix-turn-helix domain-containing protein n=1 Tax=Niabella aurantiaca TaxID=379900 RepID=UPI000376AB3A|nr:helix-turn-helix transcriptional regulator [Niabella aurantiaca]